MTGERLRDLEPIVVLYAQGSGDEWFMHTIWGSRHAVTGLDFPTMLDCAK